MNARDQAIASLADIAAVEHKTHAAVAYSRASAYLFLWGPLVAMGAALNQFFPDEAAAIWLGIDAVGFAGSFAIALNRRREGTRGRVDWRLVATFLIFAAYGIAWSCLFAPAGHERIAVFWATLMMMPYVIAGLWLGPLFSVCGLVGTVLSFGAFAFAGPCCTSGSV
jgi:hypothetical protein